MSTTNAANTTPIHLPAIDRQSVRALVASDAAELLGVATIGGNVHQGALDQQDRIQQFAAGLNESDALKFNELYQQELIASASAAKDKLADKHAQANAQLLQSAQNASNVSIWISIIVFFIILIGAIRMLR